MKHLIVGNWKCNPATLAEAQEIFNSVARGVENINGAEVVICPPFVYLPALEGLKLGAQDCFWEEKGAFTGEISPQMLKGLGVEYVILGHSERRKYQKETDKVIKKKLIAVLAAGLKPILCIDNISQIPNDIKEGFIVAYEPLFAIGTGKACPPEIAEKMRLGIKKTLYQSSGQEGLVLYGGSVNSQNAGEYFTKANFDGFLLGGASLKPQELIDIVKIAC